MKYPYSEGAGSELVLGVAEVQQAMASDEVMDPSLVPGMQETIEELQRRLMKVRSFGGDFSLVEFSTDMQAVVRQLKRSNRHAVVLD